MISVIVPVYKVEAFLPKCVASIREQTYKNLEIILVDDGSPDNCGAMCDAFALEDSRIKVIHKPNGGLSDARNAGIDIAQGEYLGFVDSDDWIEPETYQWMFQLVREYGVKMVCAGRYDVDSATGKRTLGLCPKKEEVISGKELARRIFLWDNADSSSCDKLYHRSLFESARYPVGKTVEDVPVIYRIALETERVAMLDRPVYNYYHRPGSITTSSVSEKSFHYSQHTAEIYDYIRDNHPDLIREAQYLRVQSLVYDVCLLDVSDRQTRKKYNSQYRSSRKSLRTHLWFVLTAPYFPIQDRVTDLLLLTGLYRAARWCYHLLKPRKA